jgi:hypothetical protein
MSLFTLLRRMQRRFRKRRAPNGPVAFAALERLVASFDGDALAPELLYFGDSVLERIAREDDDRRSLAELVVGTIPRSLAISHSAYQPMVYQELLRAVLAMKQRPRTLLLPINMRCFSPQWDLHPDYQFVQELGHLTSYLQDRVVRRLEPRETSASEMKVYERTAVAYPTSELRTVGEFVAVVRSKPTTDAERSRRIAEIFRFHYGHPLEPTQRKLACVRGICDLVEGAGMRAVVYVTPINHEAGLRHAGAELLRSYQRNVDVVRDELAPWVRRGVVALHDGSTLLGSQMFFQPELPSEHMNAAGRRALADQIAQWVSSAR